jgi:hypothetical protein
MRGCHAALKSRNMRFSAVLLYSNPEIRRAVCTQSAA